jgi:TonB family protein
MFWLALTAQLIAPAPQYMWLSNDDTPVNELSGRDFALVRLRLTISPKGEVARCDIEQSSGNARVDNYTCDLARRRAYFRPARSAEGAPVYGIYRAPIVWAIGPAKLKVAADLEAKLNPRPKGIHLPAYVRVIFAVDEIGQISGCSDEPPSSQGMKPNNPTLVPIACDQLIKNFRATPAIDDNGRPVQSIQNASVAFVKE